MIDRGHQMKVDAACDPREHNVGSLEQFRPNRHNSDQLPASNQRHHRGTHRSKLHRLAGGHAAGDRIHHAHKNRPIFMSNTSRSHTASLLLPRRGRQ